MDTVRGTIYNDLVGLCCSAELRGDACKYVQLKSQLILEKKNLKEIEKVEALYNAGNISIHYDRIYTVH